MKPVGGVGFLFLLRREDVRENSVCSAAVGEKFKPSLISVRLLLHHQQEEEEFKQVTATIASINDDRSMTHFNMYHQHVSPVCPQLVLHPAASSGSKDAAGPRSEARRSVLQRFSCSLFMVKRV